jgi:hypothetical protein
VEGDALGLVPVSNTQVLIGNTAIQRASLVLDSGWQNAPNGDQRLTLTSATIETSSFTETFVPSPTTTFTSTCPTEPASILVTKTDGIPAGDVNEPLTIQPQDNNGIFRIVDCKSMYNLATSSLSGVGTYTVYAKINGVTASNPAVFDLRYRVRVLTPPHGTTFNAETAEQNRFHLRVPRVLR